MNLIMEKGNTEKYNNNSQKIRVITENWMSHNLFCPCCGNSNIVHFHNNRPVADFYCSKCNEEYELKSKNGNISNKIADGAYETMINRINSSNNPNLFVMQYDKINLTVQNLIIIPKYFFIQEIIEKRNPLSENARRAGWIGCNIILKQIPTEGKIYIVKDKIDRPAELIINEVRNTSFIEEYKLNERSWILDIFNCIDKIRSVNFTLEQVYAFEKELSIKHPDNHHIKDKIRQQLQLLRDKNIIEFCGKGNYKKVL